MGELVEYKIEALRGPAFPIALTRRVSAKRIPTRLDPKRVVRLPREMLVSPSQLEVIAATKTTMSVATMKRSCA
jgi:hypothetical protein